MRSIALVDALKDFGRPEMPAGFGSDAGADAPAFDFPEPGLPEMPAFEAPAYEPPDIDAIVAEAVARAVEEARAEVAAGMTAEFDAALERERAAQLQALQDLEARLGRASAAAFAARLEEMEARLLGLTSDAAARVLGPIVADAVQWKAIGELGVIVRAALRDPAALRIEIRGPSSLIAAFETEIGDHGGRIAFAEAETHDLEVAIDESIYETRLSEWAASLAEAMT